MIWRYLPPDGAGRVAPGRGQGLAHAIDAEIVELLLALASRNEASWITGTWRR